MNQLRNKLDLAQVPGTMRFVPYSIGQTFTSVANNSSSATSPAVQIGPYNFVCTEIAIDMVSDSGYTTDVSAQIRDEGKSQYFTKDNIHLNAVRDNDTHKWILPVPWRFDAHSSIYIQVTNNDTGGVNVATIRLIFIGYLEQPLEYKS